jgi:Cu-Zn family superoxide dismutase
MRRVAGLTTTVLTAGVWLALAAPSAAADPTRAASGSEQSGAATSVPVQLHNAEKQPVGEAVLRQTPNGVLISVKLRDMPPGEHGFHIHETGKCEPPFESAGGHFNPTRKEHGFENVKGAHAGDLPNVVVPAGGALEMEVLAHEVTLEAGKTSSLLDGDGAALIVHSGPDDYRTNPAGDSGARIACGVIAHPATGAPEARETRAATGGESAR